MQLIQKDILSSTLEKDESNLIDIFAVVASAWRARSTACEGIIGHGRILKKWITPVLAF
jgi:hypothetical protein